jgi:hypothetical protein
MFKPEHVKALADKLGAEVAKELSDMHTKLFPDRNKPVEPDDDAEKSE